MLTNGINILYFVMMHKRSGFKLSTKGIVCQIGRAHV